jgi:hypothetical protein
MVKKLVMAGLILVSLPINAKQNINEWQYRDFNNSTTGTRTHVADIGPGAFVQTIAGGAAIKIELNNLTSATTLELHILTQYPRAIDCGSPCKIDIVFDDEDRVTVAATINSSGRNQLIIIPDYELMQRLKASTSITVPIKLVGDDAHDLQLRVSGLDWPRDDK